MSIFKRYGDRLQGILELPGFLGPWLDLFFTDDEILLVLLLAEKSLTLDEIGNQWNPVDKQGDLFELQDFLDRSLRRGIVSRGDDGRYQPAGFHERFDSWALFEGWMDIPDDIRDRLNAWELAYYIERHADQISTLKAGGRCDPGLTWPAYVLLPEAMQLIEQADHFYLWPCNCRSMMGGCTQNIYTCIRFENKRDAGWEISRARAQDIVKSANKSGLMQNAEIALDPNGRISGAICNCCADCCFPHQLAEQLEAAALWPLSRYVADHLTDPCIACGKCVNRCPFEALRYSTENEIQPDGSPQGRRHISFDRGLCRGCGVCSTGCAENAIEMIRLAHVQVPWESRLKGQSRNYARRKSGFRPGG